MHIKLLIDYDLFHIWNTFITKLYYWIRPVRNHIIHIERDLTKMLLKIRMQIKLGECQVSGVWFRIQVKKRDNTNISSFFSFQHLKGEKFIEIEKYTLKKIHNTGLYWWYKAYYYFLLWTSNYQMIMTFFIYEIRSLIP